MDRIKVLFTRKKEIYSRSHGFNFFINDIKEGYTFIIRTVQWSTKIMININIRFLYSALHPFESQRASKDAYTSTSEFLVFLEENEAISAHLQNMKTG